MYGAAPWFQCRQCHSQFGIPTCLEELAAVLRLSGVPGTRRHPVVGADWSNCAAGVSTSARHVHVVDYYYYYYCYYSTRTTAPTEDTTLAYKGNLFKSFQVRR